MEVLQKNHKERIFTEEIGKIPIHPKRVKLTGKVPNKVQKLKEPRLLFQPGEQSLGFFKREFRTEYLWQNMTRLNVINAKTELH